MQWHLVVDPKGNLNRLSKPEVWRAFEQHIIRAATEEGKGFIQRTAEGMFKNPTGAMANAWSTSYDVEKNTGHIKNSKNYAYYLNVGVRRQQMTWLLNAKMKDYTIWRHGEGWSMAIATYRGRSFIPIKRGNTTIFRRATEKAMREGKWWHPGIFPKRYIEWGLARFKYERLPDLCRDVTVKLIVNGDLT